jgi:hypothetical protein
MQEEVVLKHLKQVHREIEQDAGQDPDLVTDEACPADSLRGFDSPLIPNVIRAVGKAMGIEFPKGKRLTNCYIDSKGKHLTLKEIAKRFCALYANGASTK